MNCIVHCTLYIVHCTLYIVHCTLCDHDRAWPSLANMPNFKKKIFFPFSRRIENFKISKFQKNFKKKYFPHLPGATYILQKPKGSENP